MSGPKKDEILDVIKRLNPWWDDPREWTVKDEDLRAAEYSGLRPRLYHIAVKKWVNPVIEKKAWAIRVLRGPRRVGKTTLIKTIIKKAIELGMPPKAVAYLSLDDEELQRIISRLSLRVVLELLVEEARARGGGRAVIVIDEATFYDKWALAVKNLIDQGTLRMPGSLLIVTGSYSLELSEAKRQLEGRMGSIGGDSRGQRFIYPFRFSEVLESLSKAADNVYKSFTYKGRPLRSIPARLALLKDLSTPGEAESIEALENLWDEIGLHAESHFWGYYMLVGGFPRALTRIINIKRGVGSIDDLDEDYNAAFDLLLRDASRFSIDEEYLELFIRQALLQPAKHTNYGNLSQVIVTGGKRGSQGHGRRLGLEQARKMLDYLVDGARYLIKLRRIVEPSGEGVLATPQPDPGGEIKLIYSDPLLFHSLFWVSQGHKTRVAELAESILEPRPDVKGSEVLAPGLLEAVVCSHVSRIDLLTQGDDAGNYGFWKHEDTEVFDCASWWMDSRERRVTVVPIEVTWSPRKAADKMANASATLSGFNRRLILVIGEKGVKPRLEASYDVEMVVVPAPLFLALI